jgi:poly(ribitol-phosphate) beta-N-acetylglucosaminyltransferase
MVKVSVVVPVYDPGEYIEPLLDSLRGQSLPADEWEAVFVDDGSADGTPERLKALTARHAHLRFAAIPRSGWPGRPRNTGIDLARGEYVFFADQDDWLSPEALERLYAMAVADDADIVIGKVVGHGKGVPRDVFRRNRHGVTAREVPFSLLAPHKLFRRRLLEEHGLRFPEGPRRLEDHALVVPAFFFARRISILAEYPCYHWARRSDGGNASRQRPNPAAYFGAVREVLDVVDAHTEPGPLRERLYLRWYRGKLLAGFSHSSFARDDPEQRRAMFQAARELATDRFAPELDARLSYSGRLRASLLRRGSLEGLQALSGTLGTVKASARVRDVRGDGTWLTLRVTGRLRTRDAAHPLRVDADRRLVAPAALRAHLTEDELDLTGALADPAAVVLLRSLADGAEWELPTECTVKLLETKDGSLRPQVRLLARLSPTVAAAGAPLPPGDYEVHAVVAVAGFVASARVLCAGEPFVVTVTPALRLEHWRRAVAPPGRPTPSRRARRTLARVARSIPGLVPAVRRAQRRMPVWPRE